MDENLFYIGMKIDITKPEKREEDLRPNITYVSQIMDMTDDLLTCAMPIHEGHIVPLENGAEYDVFFYAQKNIYKGICRVESRGKEGNIYTCQLRPLTKLVKFQRRQFYRLPCTIDVLLTPMVELEMLAYLKDKKVPDKLINRADKVMAVDISGGGIRIISNQKYAKGAFAALEFVLYIQNQAVNVRIMGQIIQIIKSGNDNQLYDYRIQFREILRDVQDNIVKYIFEEQRKMRRKELS
ncbi:MAG: flagellar brake protein [Eubacteriales bacterium]|nr:flagellar brake protein [Eubacteriales bacterium]